MKDAVVVGAGPGGSLTAYELARKGVDVGLLEKDPLPRYKPCGGGLPPHAVTLLENLGINLDPFVENVADTIKFLFDFEDPVVTDLSDAPVVMVNRADFDYGLVEQATDAGAELREEAEVHKVVEADECVEIELKDGTEIRSRFLIGADGAGSQVARSVGLREDHFYGVAIDAEVELDRETFEREQQQATFNINFVEKGYGWIFPKDGYLALGVGGYDNDQSYPTLIDTYIERSLPGATIENKELYGHPLPFFEQKSPVSRGRVGLVGDAANMVDSLSGEGIFYALKSGRIAADSVAKALEHGMDDLSYYEREISKTVMKELQWSSRLANVFFQFPRKCYQHGVKRTTIVNLIKRVVRSEESYDEIYGAIWEEIKKRMNTSTLKQVVWN